MYELGFFHRSTLILLKLPAQLPNWPWHLVAQRLHSSHHGDFEKWQTAIATLPTTGPCPIDAGDVIHIDHATSPRVIEALQQLMPWRKGPFQIGECLIDTEWRSDWKWNRLAAEIDLAEHRVLDVGSGNGYFGWRMLGAGAREVIGIDPTLLFCMQHQAIQHFAQHPKNWVLPLGIEEIPSSPVFDSVFSMGVIYHRRTPTEHLQELRQQLRPGGQLVLESIVTPDPTGFKPAGRYARMRNVWWIPSVAELYQWLEQAGFKDIQCLDVSTTTVDEQRSTPWMTFESLAHSLDPEDSEKTVEGYPAPQRAVMLAHL